MNALVIKRMYAILSCPVSNQGLLWLGPEEIFYITVPRWLEKASLGVFVVAGI